MPRRESYVPRNYAADLRSDGGSVRRILRMSAVCMHDIALARALCGDGESRRASTFGKSAVRRANNDLRVTASSEGLRERPERLLPAAPGAVGIDVRDVQWPQKTRVTLGVRVMLGSTKMSSAS
jgi:hypothetical protein